MKRGRFLALAPLVLLSSLNLVSAYTGGYNTMSFSGLFSGLFNMQNYILGFLFLAIFGLLYFAAQRTLFANSFVSWFIPAGISLYGVWQFSTMNLTAEGIASYIGVTAGLLSTILLVLGIIIFIFLIMKSSILNVLSKIFLLLGAGIIVLSIARYIYELSAGIMIGIALIVLGIVLNKIRKKGFPRGGSGWSIRGKFTSSRMSKRSIKKAIKKLEKKRKISYRIGDIKEVNEIDKQIRYLKDRLNIPNNNPQTYNYQTYNSIHKK